MIVNNENLCADAPDLLLLIYVYSAPQDFKKRQAIRATYGNKKLFDGKTEESNKNVLIQQEIVEKNMTGNCC